MSEKNDRVRRDARMTAVQSTGHTRQLRKRLREARESLDLSLEDVAEMIRVGLNKDAFSPSSVSHYEHFRRHPPVDVMAMWARSVGKRLVVDIVDADSDRKQVLLRPRVARLAMALDLANDAQIAAIEAVIAQMLPLQDIE